MRRLLPLALIAASLAACGPTIPINAAGSTAVAVADATLPPPITIADRSTLDEVGALATERTYKLARVSIEALVDLGALKGARAAQAAAIDNRLYAAVGVMRRAYRAGNAASYRAAVAEINALTDQVAALFAGSPR